MGALIDRSRARRARLAATLAMAALSMAACATGPDRTGPGGPAAPYKVGKPYQVKGRWYTPAEQPRYDEVGIGSWYGEQFHNRFTASGEVFDMDRVSAAHRTLPLPCLVEVTNLDNGRKAIIRVNDRGPFVDGRIIDLSRAAADGLGYRRQGAARVRVRYVGPAPAGVDARAYRASAPAPDGVFRIQAAAFADRKRAEATVRALAPAGRAEIVEARRGDVILYRVQVTGRGEARAAREQVASLGYSDARVVDGD